MFIPSHVAESPIASALCCPSWLCSLGSAIYSLLADSPSVKIVSVLLVDGSPLAAIRSAYFTNMACTRSSSFDQWRTQAVDNPQNGSRSGYKIIESVGVRLSLPPSNIGDVYHVLIEISMAA